MPTIHSMMSSTYMMYRFAQKNGASLFGSASASGFNPYASSSSSTSSVLSGLTGISTSKRELLSDYASTSKRFYTEFDSTMKDLRDSAQAIKRMDFHMGKDAVTTSENEDGTTSVKKSEEMVAALKAVENLASDYNDAIDFFADNGDVSKRMGRLQTSFADTTYRSGIYGSIGIVVDAKTGKMTIDEDKLTKAIVDSPERVSGILGKHGLADKAESHISQANSERNRLFPSVQSMFGSDLSKSAVYSGRSLLNISRYANVGNLLNMWV